MLKISNKASTNLSLVFSGVFMASVIIMSVLVPFLIPRFEEMTFPARQLSKLSYLYLIFVVYLILIVAAIADAFLFALLLKVREGLVFCDKSISYIRFVSWSVFAEAFLFLLLFPFNFFACFIFIAAFMLGMALRVVKNVLGEAILIKTENDYTV